MLPEKIAEAAAGGRRRNRHLGNLATTGHDPSPPPVDPMAYFLRASLILLLVTATSCGGRSADTTPDADQSAMVQVQNQGFSDMVVYAVSGGQRLRLGLATGHSTKAFTVPRHLIRGAGPIRFIADPVGGNRTPVSEELVVEPGDVVTLTIPPQ